MSIIATAVPSAAVGVLSIVGLILFVLAILVPVFVLVIASCAGKLLYEARNLNTAAVNIHNRLLNCETHLARIRGKSASKATPSVPATARPPRP